MENATDALKMAAAVLVFVMALGIGISSFSQARVAADTLISYTDRDSVTQYAEDIGTRTRFVGKETIVPTIYRAYKENYRIQFYEADGTTPIVLYTKIEDGAEVEVNYVDLERDNLGNHWQQDNFIMALLYGAKGTYKKADGSSMTFDEFQDELLLNNSRVTLNYQGIYDIILEGNTFEEKYGVYYQDDITIDDSDGMDPDDFGESETPDVNKTKKRVISYCKQ
mgnify:CR=1 FL=1